MKKTKVLIPVLTLCLFALCAFLMRPSDKDVAKCMETTNYTAERCVMEIMR